jgi:hypothetical protein
MMPQPEHPFGLPYASGIFGKATDARRCDWQLQRVVLLETQ